MTAWLTVTHHAPGDELPGTRHRVVFEGTTMRTLDGFFAELRRVLKLSERNGSSFEGLSTAFSDLDVIGRPASVLVVNDADQLLADEPPEQLSRFLAVLRKEAKWTAEPFRLALVAESVTHAGLRARCEPGS